MNCMNPELKRGSLRNGGRELADRIISSVFLSSQQSKTSSGWSNSIQMEVKNIHREEAVDVLIRILL